MNAPSILKDITTNGGITLTREDGLAFFRALRDAGKRVDGLEDSEVVDCAIVAFGSKGKHIIARPASVGGDDFYGFAPRKTFNVSYEAI
jgi:hypothetical protein